MERRELIQQLETIGEQLCETVPPGHVTYVSKQNAGRACKRIADALRQIADEVEICCGTAGTGIRVSDLFLGEADVELLTRFLEEHHQYTTNVCVSVLLANGLNAWDAGQKRLAAAEAAVRELEGLKLIAQS